MKITVLGSGTMMPTKDRNPAGFLVDMGEKIILLDCGHGIIRRMIDFDIDPQDIDMLFVSHFHTDHAGDAFSLIHSCFVENLYEKRRHRPLDVYGPIETKDNYIKWRSIFWREEQETYPLQFHKKLGRYEEKSYTISLFPVTHVKWYNSIGIILEKNDQKLVYTGDVGSDQNVNDLITVCEGANLLIVEASYEHPTPNHYTIEQVIDLKERANVEKVLIVHIRPQHLKSVENLVKRRDDFILGIDGLKIEI